MQVDNSKLAYLDGGALCTNFFAGRRSRGC